MSRPQHAVRYYIDRNDEGAEVRSVPVAVREAPAPQQRDLSTESGPSPASRPTSPKKRSRVTRLVRSAVRRSTAGGRT
ncbi:MAG: hypothetical protein H0W06_13100 [Chloroflexia bacterium]|nr:hypothetical protein [Chloroflexia bacterium]